MDILDGQNSMSSHEEVKMKKIIYFLGKINGAFS
jgi:hypothetical protein